MDQLGKEKVTVEVRDGLETLEKPWQEYLKDHVDEKLHSMMKRNVLLATRNFQHRVESFRKEVIFGQNNPMKVRHISYRVEFQGRGAAHIHGVLWLDLNEIKVEGVHNGVLKESYSKLKNSQPLEPAEVRALEKFTDTFVTCTRCVSVAGAEAVRNAEETNWHGHSSSCKKGGARLCRWKFPRYPLARTIFVDANREYQEEGRMEAKVRDEILDRVMKVLVEEKGGKKVLSKRVERIMLSNRYPNVRKINQGKEDEDTCSETEVTQPSQHPSSPNAFEEAQTHQPPSSQNAFEATLISQHPSSPHSFEETLTPQHSHPDDPGSPHSFEETSNSQYSYPDDPSSPAAFEDEQAFQGAQNSCQGAEKLAKEKTRQPLAGENDPLAEKAKKKPNTVTYIKMESPEEYKMNIRKRIDEVLKKASAGGEPITYEKYEQAVIEQPRKGSEVLLQRDIDEIFINNYNAEWIVAWDANIDISPVYDYYGTITYITDYFTKVSSLAFRCENKPFGFLKVQWLINYDCNICCH